MALTPGQLIFLCAIGILLLAKPAHAFGAGNIGSTSKIEGQNWRHGDLEDTLLTIVASKAMGGKKFGKLDVKRVYFGNWLRDYSQAVDVGTVKYVSAEAIRILLWVLGFMSFGYGSKEFEVTTERLGCYRPEEHIDNPKDYAENEDARQYDRRLRGPVDERRELAINPDTGMKNYIASENMGIDTSAGLVRKLFTRCIQLGRQYARSKNKKDLYEALRLLGTGSHCLEDFAAHSNYLELALIEMGERDVFPHVGRRTGIQLRGGRNEVYPLVTGTFGGVDFLHSVCGEFDDKVTQSEVEELEGTLQQADNNQDGSILQDLFDKVPSGVFGDKDEKAEAEKLKQNAQAHRMSNARISPRQPEEWTRYLDDVRTQIYPIIEWHDEVMQSITETVEKIPILPDLIDNIQDEVNKFVFSLLAPYVVPIIHQVKNELNTGSSEIIQGSKNAQHIVFNDDRSSDPTHSMLSKDHFSNILNEPAGKVASWTVKWVVPQLIAAWDDERVDINRTCDRIIRGILHHPAQRGATGIDGAGDGRRAMFQVVEKWWHGMDERQKDDYRDKLSRRGVEQGRNHKEGVMDHGHGSMKPLGMANVHDKSSYPAAQAVDAVGNLVGELTGSGGGQGRPQSGQYGGGQYGGSQYSRQSGGGDTIGRTASEAVGGGILGTLVGGVASAVGKDMLGGGLDEDKKTYKRESYGHDGSRTETYTQVGRSSGGDRYGQAQYSRTQEPSGGQSEQYTRYEQHPTRGGGYETEVRRQERDSQGRVHEDTQRYSGSGGYGSGAAGYGSNTTGYGQSETYSRQEGTTSAYSSGGYGQPQRRRDSNDSDKKKSRYGKKDDSDDDDYKKKKHHGKKDDSDSEDEKKRNKRSSGYGGSGYQQQQPSHSGGYGGREERSEYSSGAGYGRQEQSYGGGAGGYGRQEQQTSGYGRRDEDESYRSGGGGGYGSQQQSYGRQEESYGSGGGQGYGSQQQGYGSGASYGRQEESYGSGGGYGRQEQSSYGGGGQYGGGRQDESSYGGGGQYGGTQEESYGGGYSTGGGGGRQEYGGRGDDEGGVDMPGGFGEGGGDNDQGYGGRRRDEDDSGYGRY